MERSKTGGRAWGCKDLPEVGREREWTGLSLRKKGQQRRGECGVWMGEDMQTFGMWGMRKLRPRTGFDFVIVLSQVLAHLVHDSYLNDS